MPPGRLDDPTLAYRLLMSESYEEAFDLASEVNRLNEERQALTRTYEALAHEMVQAQFEAASTRWCVAASIGRAASWAWSRASWRRPTTARRWSTARATTWSLAPGAASRASICSVRCRLATTCSSATAGTRRPPASACRRTASTSSSNGSRRLSARRCRRAARARPPHRRVPQARDHLLRLRALSRAPRAVRSRVPVPHVRGEGLTRHRESSAWRGGPALEGPLQGIRQHVGRSHFLRPRAVGHPVPGRPNA